MTLLQDAEKQLHDALEALESAVQLATQSGDQSGAGDFRELAHEVAAIESTLEEAMQLIATANSTPIGGSRQ